jgi:hypothetical protein
VKNYSCKLKYTVEIILKGRFFRNLAICNSVRDPGFSITNVQRNSKISVTRDDIHRDNFGESLKTLSAASHSRGFLSGLYIFFNPQGLAYGILRGGKCSFTFFTFVLCSVFRI